MRGWGFGTGNGGGSGPLTLWLASAVWALSTSLTSPHPVFAQDARTPLTSVGVVESIDAPADPGDPGVGGGFDATGYFRNVLTDKIATCTRQIQLVVDRWLAEQSLRATLRERSEAHLLVHAARAGLPGFFEVTYRIDRRNARARVTLFFVGGDGAWHEPAGIRELLVTYGVATFQDNLDKAIQCGDA